MSAESGRWASRYLESIEPIGRFDVVATAIKTGARRLIAEDENKREATAIQFMAVARRGCDVEVFSVEPHPAKDITTTEVPADA